MITTTDIGRTMMFHAANIEDDTEFNKWARLGPILINQGIVNYSTVINNFSVEDQLIINQAVILLMKEVNNT